MRESDDRWKEWPLIALGSHFHLDLRRRGEDETTRRLHVRSGQLLAAPARHARMGKGSIGNLEMPKADDVASRPGAARRP